MTWKSSRPTIAQIRERRHTTVEKVRSSAQVGTCDSLLKYQLSFTPVGTSLAAQQGATLPSPPPTTLHKPSIPVQQELRPNACAVPVYVRTCNGRVCEEVAQAVRYVSLMRQSSERFRSESEISSAICHPDHASDETISKVQVTQRTLSRTWREMDGVPPYPLLLSCPSAWNAWPGTAEDTDHQSAPRACILLLPTGQKDLDFLIGGGTFHGGRAPPFRRPRRQTHLRKAPRVDRVRTRLVNRVLPTQLAHQLKLLSGEGVKSKVPLLRRATPSPTWPAKRLSCHEGDRTD